MKRKLLAAGLAALGAAMFMAPAQAQNTRVEAGVLRCEVEGGVGFIFGSTKDLICTFDRKNGPDETYAGTINKFGIDIGVTEKSRIVWAVLAPTADIPPGTLDGRYAGISGEATVGVGVGANALIGGSDDSVVLQPVSVQAQTGLNIAAGIAGLRLHAP